MATSKDTLLNTPTISPEREDKGRRRSKRRALLNIVRRVVYDDSLPDEARLFCRKLLERMTREIKEEEAQLAKEAGK